MDENRRSRTRRDARGASRSARRFRGRTKSSHRRSRRRRWMRWISSWRTVWRRSAEETTRRRRRRLWRIYERLGAAAARKIPLCVANPDVETVSGSELIAMPGALAMWYAEAFAEAHPGEDASGHVCEMGKPDAVAYDALLGEFGVDAGGKIVAVGDSLAHDIAGANARVSTPSSCAARGYTSTTFDARRRARTRTRRCAMYAARGATRDVRRRKIAVVMRRIAVVL